MKFTRAARAIMDNIEHNTPNQAAAIGNRAKLIAIAAGADQIRAGDILAAALVASEEFIQEGEPCPNIQSPISNIP